MMQAELQSEPLIRKYWRKAMLRDAHYCDPDRGLDRLYWMQDPWNMASALEQSRFQWINELIREHLSPIDNILEVGCGEGHHSVHLSRVCRALLGTDVSRRAVRRALQRCPTARFVTGEFLRYSFPSEARFDLIVASEVLYYMEDVEAALQRCSQLGRACLVTYYENQASRLEPKLADWPGETATFEFSGRSWTARWWRN